MAVMRKAMVYLGLVEDDAENYDEYDEYEAPPPVAPVAQGGRRGHLERSAAEVEYGRRSLTPERTPALGTPPSAWPGHKTTSTSRSAMTAIYFSLRISRRRSRPSGPYPTGCRREPSNAEPTRR